MANPSQHLEFKTILAGVRTPRVAVLLNEADEDWRLTVRRIIEWASECWGGRHFILIPTDGSTIHPHFWAVLKAYDPDYIFKYHRTARDWEIGRPEKFQELVDRHVGEWVQEHQSQDREEVREMLEPEIRENVYLDNFDADPDLSRALKARLAPCYFENYVIQHTIWAGSTPQYPLCGYLPLASKSFPPQIAQLILPFQDDVLQLYSSSVTGFCNAALDRAFNERRIPKAEIRVRNSNVWLAELMLSGSIDFRNRQLEIELPHGIVTNYDFTGDLPFSWSMLNLSYFRQHGFQHWTAPIFIVIGSSIADFCLYYDLARLHDEAIWMPDEWIAAAAAGQRINEFPTSLLWDLVRTADMRLRFGRQGAHFLVFSVSKGEADLRTAINSLYEPLHQQPDNALRNCLFPQDIAGISFPRLVYERDNATRPVVVPFLDREIAGFLETPKPLNFNTISPHDHRWMTELEIQGYKLPRSPHLGSWVVRGPTILTSEARVGKYGITYFCPNSFVFSANIDEVLVRPTLSCPEALRILDEIAKKSGLTLALSDKGRFTQETITKFGSLARAAENLRLKPRRDVFLKFLDHSPNKKGVFDDGVFLKNDPRYLDLIGIRKCGADEKMATDLVDEMVALGVFKRGFLFQCEKCRQADWYEISTVANIFVCKRCGTEQLYTRRHWLNPEEPRFYYRLDEIVYQALVNGCAVTILALDELRRRSKSSFLFTSEIELKSANSKSPIEIDLAAIVDGSFTIGEAKKEGRLGVDASEEEKNIRKYGSLAQTLTVERLLFATIDEKWAESTVERAGRLLKDYDVEREFVARDGLGYV